METCYNKSGRSAATAASVPEKHRKHMNQTTLQCREGNLNQEGYTLGKI